MADATANGRAGGDVAVFELELIHPPQFILQPGKGRWSHELVKIESCAANQSE